MANPITSTDIVMIVFMITLCIGMYMAYWCGRYDERKEMARKRKVRRQFKRLRS